MHRSVRGGEQLTVGRLLLWLRLAFAGLMLTALAACAESLNTNVTRFHVQMPPPAGQSFVILPENPANAGGIEFGLYAHDVAAHLTRVGYTPASSPDTASFVVHLGYGVDNGRQQISSDPFWGPWRGYRGWGWGGGWAPRGAWGWGMYDPWFDSSTVYASHLSVRIDDRAGGQRLFEGRAEAVSTSNNLQYLVPNLIEAMFTGFPGNSGQTVRITVAPEHK